MRSYKGLCKVYGGGGGTSGAYLDPGIREIVLDLNRYGYRTLLSCEGDQYLTAEIGFVFRRPKYTDTDYQEIIRIIKSHTDIPFVVFKQGKRIDEDLTGGGGAYIMFKEPLGPQNEDKCGGGLANDLIYNKFSEPVSDETFRLSAKDFFSKDPIWTETLHESQEI